MRLFTATLAGFAMAATLVAAPLAEAANVVAPTGEVRDRNALRVCADPADLPFSNEKGEGFENKIAELLARKMGVPLEYTWVPQSIGFVRNTLRARLCDLIVGVVAADELVQNTNPYYRSAYVMAVRSADGAALADLSGEAIKDARIGVIAGTPPADLLARRGLLAHVTSYSLMVDTRYEHPAQQMMAELAAGRIDVAMIWGPIGGYYARKESVPITLVPLASDRRLGLIMDFRISMGIRPNEPEWKDQINGLLRELKPEIDRILTDYGVPRLDNQGRLIQAAVAEPDGYRMADYRAPTPATLAGATVVDTGALQALIESAHPVLLDVLPLQRRPPDRDPKAIWIDPPRDDLPGSVWLPNVGYGELTPEYAAWFADSLRRLTDGDKARPIVFYCAQNCWMSWNAARRAVRELGYTQVRWYPEGVDGWRRAGLALAPATPETQPGFVAH